MAYLLNLIYAVLLVLAAPWLVYQRIFRGKYREGFTAKFWGALPNRNSNRPCIWLHAVSVGEVNLIGVLLKEVDEQRPDVECVISTTTTTGFELAKKKYAQHLVFYCPLDFSWAVRRAMRQIRPSLLVLAELELWPNLIRAATDYGASVAIVNGRLSEKSFRGYRRLRRLLRPVLDRINLVAVQNEEYAERFRALGVDHERVRVTGSLKFDGAQVDRNNSKTRLLRELAGFDADDLVFLAGSTQAQEERLALEAFQSLSTRHPQLRLVIVPRHPHRFEEVVTLLNHSGLPWQRRSELRSGQWSVVSGQLQQTTGNGQRTTDNGHILIIDTVGELGAWWGTATIGFVGGSLFSSRGGQNMIEPAAYGVATCFGPNTQNFRDVVELLLTNNAAVRVESGEDLTTFVRRCLEDRDYSVALGQNAAVIVGKQQGATARTWEILEPLLPKSASENVANTNRQAA